MDRGLDAFRASGTHGKYDGGALREQNRNRGMVDLIDSAGERKSYKHVRWS